MLLSKLSRSFLQMNLNKAEAFVPTLSRPSSLGHLKGKEMCTVVLGRTNNHIYLQQQKTFTKCMKWTISRSVVLVSKYS